MERELVAVSESWGHFAWPAWGSAGVRRQLERGEGRVGNNPLIRAANLTSQRCRLVNK